MKIIKEDGYLIISHKDKELFLCLRNDYSQLIGSWNWYNFTFIELSIENDYQLGGVDFDFIILGLGIHLRLNYKKTEMTESLQNMINEIKSALKLPKKL